MKYKLLERESNGLCRVQALIDFSDVRAGDIGGYVEGEKNLSQYGNAWVYGNAQVYGNAWVYGNARVYGNAQVYGDVRVYGNAWVYGNAQVYGNAWVSGNAQIYGNARVDGNVRVYGNVWVYGDAWVYGNARVSTGKINKTSDYIIFKNNATSGRFFTYVFASDIWVIGCFQGDTSALLEHLEENGNDLQKAEYSLYIELIKKLKELK